jgi:hypothetical protein
MKMPSGILDEDAVRQGILGPVDLLHIVLGQRFAIGLRLVHHEDLNQTARLRLDPQLLLQRGFRAVDVALGHIDSGTGQCEADHKNQTEDCTHALYPTFAAPGAPRTVADLVLCLVADLTLADAVADALRNAVCAEGDGHEQDHAQPDDGRRQDDPIDRDRPVFVGDQEIMQRSPHYSHSPLANLRLATAAPPCHLAAGMRLCRGVFRAIAGRFVHA